MNLEHTHSATKSRLLSTRLSARRWRLVLCILVGQLFAGALVQAVEPEWEVEFLSELRTRGLYRLAVRHAEGIIAGGDITVPARIGLTIELARTLSQWGSASPPQAEAARQEELWDRSHAVLADALSELPGHPRRVLLELQDALLWFGEGEVAKEEAVLTSDGVAALLARQKLRTAIARLDDLADRVEEALRRERMSRNQSHGGEALTSDQLASLDQHIVLQTAQALIVQAETYPAESPDRINSLTRAIDQLTFLLSRAGDNELRCQAELALTTCHRLSGHLDAARRRLTAASEKPGFSAGDVAAETVRLLLAEGRTGDAIATARQQREKTDTDSPELILAHLEAVVALAVSSADGSRQPQAIQEAMQILQELAQGHGPRWQRRGELCVARMLAETNQAADTVATARLAAEGLYRSGRLGQATAAFDRAAALAREESDVDTAFDLGLTAAAVVRQAGDEQEAARRYIQLAMGDPSHPRADEAHRSGILATAAAARAASSAADRADLLAAYERLLEVHLAHWPNAPSADEVRIWLAKWWLQANNSMRLSNVSSRAAALLQEVSPQSEHFAASRRLLGEAFEQRLAEMEDPSERAAVANEAAHALVPVITGADNKWPTEWTDLQRDLALVLSRMQLVHVPDGAAYADALLTAAAADGRDAPEEWRQRAMGLLLAVNAVSGQKEPAQAIMREVEDVSADVKAEIIACLGEVLSADYNADRAAVSRTILRLLDGMQSTQPPLSESTRAQLARYRARALVAAGRRAAASAAYDDLVAQLPGDAAVHEEYAELLADGQSAPDHRKALRIYHEIERRTKPGGSRWMRSRLARIGLFNRLGEADQAKKLLRLTAAVYPDLGGPDFRPHFESMAKELGE